MGPNLVVLLQWAIENYPSIGSEVMNWAQVNPQYWETFEEVASSRFFEAAFEYIQNVYNNFF